MKPTETIKLTQNIIHNAAVLSNTLAAMEDVHRQPIKSAHLRLFNMNEVAQFMGVHVSNVKKWADKKNMPQPTIAPNGKYFYSAGQMNEMRKILEQNAIDGKKGAKAHHFYDTHRTANDRMQIIPIVNFKGGAGKTTTAVHLVQHLALTGHRVLAIDLDPQASLSAMFGVQPEIEKNPSLYDALRYDDDRVDIHNLIRPSNFPALDLVAANLELQEFEYDTPLVMAQSTGVDFRTRVSDVLAQVNDDYDVVVLDCPPQLGYVTLSALIAATGIIVPITPNMLDVLSMAQFLAMMGDILTTIEETGTNFELNFMRFAITQYDPMNLSQGEISEMLRTLFAEQVLENPVLKSAAISSAGVEKQTIYEAEIAGFTRATYNRAFESIFTINEEIRVLIKQSWGRQ